MAITPRRRALLFILALVLPSLAFIALGWWMIRSGEELARTRHAADEARVAASFGNDLLGELERIKLERLEPTRTEIAFTSSVVQGSMELPWEAASERDAFRQMLSSDRSPFGVALTQGQRFESLLQFSQAIGEFKKARSLAATPMEADYAGLLLARTLTKASHREESAKTFASLLSSKTEDDEGMPIALYAARQLVADLRSEAAAIQAIAAIVTDARWLSPQAAYLAREVLQAVPQSSTTSNRATAQQMLAAVKARIDDAERAVALARALPDSALAAAKPGSQPIWLPDPSGAWLVGVVPGPSPEPSRVIAVRTSSVIRTMASRGLLSSIQPSSVVLSTDASAGRVLGEAFPGLRLRFALVDSESSVSAWATQKMFLVISLIAVIVVTIAGGIVVWRDVRRELKLAELRSQFVASVSHELRTPLTAIRMFAETLQMERPLPPGARSEYLDTIVNESERLSRLISNVLDYAKIERGQRVYRFESASVGEVVRRAAKAMEYPLARQGFGLDVHVAEVPKAPIDEDAIEQAILNLLSNAMKYSRDRRDIELRVSGSDAHAVIEVTDHGLGIPHAEQTRIFDRFYRAEVPENVRIPGAGLGLALVDHIVKAHGGLVHVTSAPGKGSTFAIHLPLVAPAREVAS